MRPYLSCCFYFKIRYNIYFAFPGIYVIVQDNILNKIQFRYLLSRENSLSSYFKIKMGKVKVPSNDVKKDRVKNSTIRYKKRRGFGNKKNVVPVVKDPAVDAVPEADIVVEDEHVDVVVSPEREDEPLSSISLRKVENIESVTPNDKHDISGYRLIDAEVLSKVFSMLSCPECKQQTIKLGDHVSRKQGLASLLFLKCDTCEF